MQQPISPNEPPQLHRLGEEIFQNLCRDLIDAEPEISICEVYGVRGQSQYGIDLIAHRKNGNEIEVGQCKCCRTFPATKIRKVSEEFFDNWDRWSKKRIRRFILFVACDLSDRHCQDQILKEKRRFNEHEIAYDAWSSPKIINKLRPHPGIVREYFSSAPDYWASRICGEAYPASPLIEALPQASLIMSAVLAQSKQIVARLSTGTEKQLEVIRERWREGHRNEPIKWVSDLKNDGSVWLALPPNVRAKILRFEAFLVLGENGILGRAKALADEAYILSPVDDQSRLRAFIAFQEAGAERALELLTNNKDVDSLHLEAALLLESGRVDEGRLVLEGIETGFPNNAETYRLRALSFLMTKEMGKARLEILKALEIEPRWKSIRIAAGMIAYLSTLSPVALPNSIVLWPEPVDWSCVKRDNESLSRLRESAELFRQLAKEAEGYKERQHFEAWRLASLANDPDHQDDAGKYCREIIARDRIHCPAILWALARKFDIKVARSEKKIMRLIEEDKAEISHILTLACSFLASGSNKSKKAIELLRDTESVFKKEGAHNLWLFWFAQSLVVNGDPESALDQISNHELSAELRHSKTMALRAIARKTGDHQPLMDHLVSSYRETTDPVFFLESCELMAHRYEWVYVAERAEQLVKAVQTAHALRLAAIAAYNARRFEVCLRLLDQDRGLFRGNKLPSELRSIRARCCEALGMLPRAITEAESLAREEPTTANLLKLVHLYASIGDLKLVAAVARQLLDRPDMDSEKSLHLAQILQWEDRELARDLWKLATRQVISDDLVSMAISIGYGLALDAELGPLLKRMAQLGREGKGGIQTGTIEDLVSFARQRREQDERLRKAYLNGTAPIHLIAGEMNRPLVDLYHTLLEENEAGPDPIKQSPLLIRHGSRGLREWPPKSAPEFRICMDITAVLLSMHLGILTQVEKTFRPISIPADIVPALIHMRERFSHHQPKRLEAKQEIVDLEGVGSVKVIEPGTLPKRILTQLADEVGEDWVGLYEYARNKGGCLVDFFPVRKRDRSGQPATLPEDVKAHLVTCRAIVESLRNEGPLTETEYSNALEALGSEGHRTDNNPIPSQGQLLVLRGNIPEILASVNLLQTTSERFKVIIEKGELAAAKAELEEYRRRVLIADWLETLTGRLRDGIAEGTYAILPYQLIDAKESEELQTENYLSECLSSLLRFNPMGNECIWCDDRFLNSYLSRDTLPIIGVNEVLKALVAAKGLEIEDYYEKLMSLRASNARFIPVEKDEILYHLRQATINRGRLVESRPLSILRRYIAACLAQGDILQRPPMPEGSPNKYGEVAFVMSLLREIGGAVLDVWAEPHEDASICEARAEWIMNSLYLDHLGAIKAFSPERSQQDDQYLVALGLAGLLSQAIGLAPSRSSDTLPARRRYFKWVWDRVLMKQFDANPELIVTVAECLKRITLDVQEKGRSKGAGVVKQLLRAFYGDLPDAIQNELMRDNGFMTGISLERTLIQEVEDLKFRADDFWATIAEVINGRTAKITTIETALEVSFHPVEDGSEGVVCFGHPVTGEKKIIINDIFGVLSDSANKREIILRKNRIWFDCPNDDFENAVGEIASTDNIRSRIEKTLSWRESSYSVYCQTIMQKVIKRQGIKLRECVPPSADGLLRHLRLKRNSKAGSEFEECFKTASEMLVREEGLFEAINRLSGLPVPFPDKLLEVISGLPLHDQRELIKRLARAGGSPVSKIHLLRILVHLSDRIPGYRRLARRLAMSLLDSEAVEEFEAFYTVLKWVYEEIVYSREVEQCPAPIRLALVWAHSDRLFAVLKTAGGTSTGIRETFKMVWSRIPFEVLERDPEYWFDIAHPRQINREGFVLTGLAYGLGEVSGHILEPQLKSLITGLAVNEIDGHPIPALALLRDPGRARNCLSSFLARDRGVAVYELTGDENAKNFERQSLSSVLEQALESLASPSDPSLGWGLVHAIIGDLPPPQGLIQRIKEVFLQTNYVELFKNAPLYAGIALQTASSQAGNIGDEELRSHLVGQIIRIASLLSEKPDFQFGPQVDGPSKNNGKGVMILLESALNLALAAKSKESVAAELTSITIKIVEAWNTTIREFRPVIQRLCDELPIRHARDLWPLLIRLRAG